MVPFLQNVALMHVHFRVAQQRSLRPEARLAEPSLQSVGSERSLHLSAEVLLQVAADLPG